MQPINNKFIPLYAKWQLAGQVSFCTKYIEYLVDNTMPDSCYSNTQQIATNVNGEIWRK